MQGQTTFADIEYAGRRRTTRREEFLKSMDSVVPWADWVALVGPHRPRAGGRGGQPVPTERLLRMYMVQCWYNLSDEATEDACYDSYAVRSFVGLDYAGAQAPDATTLCKFRNMLAREGLDAALFEDVKARLEAAGLVMHGGSAIDATIVAAPPSTRNSAGARDPEMHQARKGNQWHFGMKVHAGVDAGMGYVHSVAATAANVHDIEEAHALVRADDAVVWADSGYTGVGKRPEVASDPLLSGVEWRVAGRPSRLPPKDGPDWWTAAEESRKASVRSVVEHAFHMAKGLFGYRKARYRGIAKNLARFRVLFASANLLKVLWSGRAGDFRAGEPLGVPQCAL